MGCLSNSSIVKAVYISHFALLDNEESFPKVMVNSAPSLIPLFFQGHVTITLHCILNPEIQLSSYTPTREHQLYVRALLNSSLRAHSAQNELFWRKAYSKGVISITMVWYYHLLPD